MTTESIVNLPAVDNPRIRKLLERDYATWKRRTKIQSDRVCRICHEAGSPSEMREIKYNNRGHMKTRYEHWRCQK